MKAKEEEDKRRRIEKGKANQRRAEQAVLEEQCHELLKQNYNEQASLAHQ